MTDVGPRAGTHASTRIELVARVRARRPELEAAIMASVRGGGDGIEGEEDPEYMTGLHAAISAAVEHGLDGIENAHSARQAPPLKAIAQARRAARAGVSVDTVLHRYMLGSTLLGDFLMQEASRIEIADAPQVLREILGAQAGVLDRLVRAVRVEHRRELERARSSPERRRAERVQLLLAGGRCDSEELGYDLAERWHLGMIATGESAAQTLKRLAAEMSAQLLCVKRGGDALWAWLGARRPLAACEVERSLDPERDRGACIALGEPGEGIEGWRLTHRQAQAALRVALLRPRLLTRYADVALVACVLRDDALARSLTGVYLAPLGPCVGEGVVLRDTLRAYFAAGRNATSAASMLGVARHTVAKRLHFIEERLGLALPTRQAELEVALRLEELRDRRNPDSEREAGSAYGPD